MMPAEITGWGAAFGAGLVTSLHCLGMCGPLACTACASGKGRENARLAFIYHGSRVCAYVILGVLAALIGRRLSDALLVGVTQWAVWIWVPFFVLVFLGWDRRLPFSLPAGLGHSLGSVSTRLNGLPRAAGMGFFTFLLPCLPLYWVIATAGLSGSPWRGGAIMAFFGLGTIPLLLVAHTPFSLTSRCFPLGARDWVRRGLAAMALFVLVLRGTASVGVCCR